MTNKEKYKKIFIESLSIDNSSFDEKIKYNGKYNVILDDASHTWKHQLFSFSMLWDEVKPGGLYIVEDILTSFSIYQSSYNPDNLPLKSDMFSFSFFLSELINSFCCSYA